MTRLSRCGRPGLECGEEPILPVELEVIIAADEGWSSSIILQGSRLCNTGLHYAYVVSRLQVDTDAQRSQ